MDWSEWHRQYDSFPNLEARLQIVREQIAATLDDCPAGPIRIVSICAGDGRDLIGALQNHRRRNDVAAALLDTEEESLARGRKTAAAAGLQPQLRFINADATRATNYAGLVPADLVLLSGFLGHLRHGDIPGLIHSLPMFCKAGGSVIWNRHLVLYDGRQQVRVIRELFQQSAFEEVHHETTAPDGFAVGRARFTGQPAPLDTKRVLFEFVGLDRLLAEPAPAVPAASSSGVRIPERTPGPTPGAPAAEDACATAAEQSLVERFEQVLAGYSARPAIGSGEWRPTYSEFNRAANRLAQALISGAGATGDRVALLMRHDAPLIVAMLAVLKAGRVVVVLNPGDPPARLQQILADAEPAAIVTDAANRKLAGQIAGRSLRVIGYEDQSTGPAHNPELKLAPHDLAFLLFTSGSTGRPKGVMQTHRNMLHNVLRQTRGMELRPEDRIVLLGSPGGGQGMATAWCALLNGAALCPFPAAEKGVTSLAKWLKENQITVYVSSVSVFRHFIRTLDRDEQLPSIRVVRFASEPASDRDFAAWQQHFPDGCVLLNTLSSTETGNFTRQRFTRSDRVGEGRLPVGRAVEGMQILLLDEQGREAGEGGVGEIVVRSRYLSPGYWRNESLTAERFSAAGPDGGRNYRGGDLGRRTADGGLVFMDRKDARVKIRGYRIELSEIEDALERQPDVAGAVVCARPGPDNELQLVAYVVPEAGRSGTAETLRHALRASLPGYMIPAAFVFLDEFPLSPNGKVDRQALPAPEENGARLHRSEKPRGIVEGSLERIWESVLGLAPIGRHDDFFDLGGNSIQSTQVLAGIEESFGFSLPPSTLAEHGTIERLAALVSGNVVIPSPSPLVPLRMGGAGRPLFLVHSGQGDVAPYGLLARRLPDRPVYGLQSVGLQGEAWPLMTVPDMARRYLREITAVDPAGPYLFGATCMGGMVAFEMAQMLVRQGKQVALLALMDVRYPLKPWQQHEWVERWYGPFRDPVRDAFRILRWAIIRAVGLGRGDRWLPAYRRFVAHMNSRADRNYTPVIYPAEMTLFVTADTQFPREDLRLLLRPYAKESRVITISGIRRGLFFRPTVDELAQNLQQAIERAEGRKS
jgi:amino acid adenylation domain-containing protein